MLKSRVGFTYPYTARAHRVARVVYLPQAEQRGAAPALLHQGNSRRRTLAVLEHPRREATVQCGGVEAGSGGEKVAPINERLA